MLDDATLVGICTECARSDERVVPLQGRVRCRETSGGGGEDELGHGRNGGLSRDANMDGLHAGVLECPENSPCARRRPHPRHRRRCRRRRCCCCPSWCTRSHMRSAVPDPALPWTSTCSSSSPTRISLLARSSPPPVSSPTVHTDFSHPRKGPPSSASFTTASTRMRTVLFPSSRMPIASHPASQLPP